MYSAARPMHLYSVNYLVEMIQKFYDTLDQIQEVYMCKLFVSVFGQVYCCLVQVMTCLACSRYFFFSSLFLTVIVKHLEPEARRYKMPKSIDQKTQSSPAGRPSKIETKNVSGLGIHHGVVTITPRKTELLSTKFLLKFLMTRSRVCAK